MHHIKLCIRTVDNAGPPRRNNAEPRRLLVRGAVVFDHHKIKQPVLYKGARIRVARAESRRFSLRIGTVRVGVAVLPDRLRIKPDLYARRILTHRRGRRLEQRARDLALIRFIAHPAAALQITGIGRRAVRALIAVEQNAVRLVRFGKRADIFRQVVKSRAVGGQPLSARTG